MSVLTGKSIVSNIDLAASIATIYTVPSTLNRVKIDAIAFTNHSASNVDLTVHIVPSGSSAATTNKIVSAKTIKAGASYLAPELIGQAVLTGGTIQAFASSASSVNCTITGTEYN